MVIWGTEENLILKNVSVVKDRFFSATAIEEMHDYIEPLLRNRSNNVILHGGKNNTSREPFLEKILALKSFIGRGGKAWLWHHYF